MGQSIDLLTNDRIHKLLYHLIIKMCQWSKMHSSSRQTNIFYFSHVKINRQISPLIQLQVLSCISASTHWPKIHLKNWFIVLINQRASGKGKYLGYYGIHNVTRGILIIQEQGAFKNCRSKIHSLQSSSKMLTKRITVVWYTNYIVRISDHGYSFS